MGEGLHGGGAAWGRGCVGDGHTDAGCVLLLGLGSSHGHVYSVGNMASERWLPGRVFPALDTCSSRGSEGVSSELF